MKKIYLPLLSLALSTLGLRAQTTLDLVHGSIGVQGIFTSKDNTPFWMHANQYGSIPLPGTSGSLIGAVRKDYNTLSTGIFDWGAGVEVRGDVGNDSRATLIEGYAKLKIAMFEVKAGRSKDVMGLVDTTLSTGAFAQSGNALGIPKVEISIPQYWSLPFWGKLFAIKGNFAYGWLGTLPIQYMHNTDLAKTYFHQKSLYVRLGKPEWSWRLIGGFNHQVYWGDERLVFGSGYTLNTFDTYLHVITGRTFNFSKVGNHLGSIDMGAEIDFNTFRLSIYRQNFYDEGALYKLANIKDGLNGLEFINTQETTGGFHWKKVLFEFLYSVNQAGLPTSKYTNSGDENYYNNYEYTEGWSYKGQALGNPFFSTRTSTRSDLPNDTTDFFNNNRVAAFYLGFEGSANTWDFRAKFSYSLNYGTYGTSVYGHSTGNLRVPPHFGIWNKVSQFSSYLEVNKEVMPGLQVGCVAALDHGKLLNNTGGFLLKLSKTF